MDLTIGELIDRLSIANVRLWMLQDKVADAEEDSVVAKAAKDIEKANAERSQLRAAINEFFGDREEAVKSYGEKGSPE